jgi:hypothetical protein
MSNELVPRRACCSYMDRSPDCVSYGRIDEAVSAVLSANEMTSTPAKTSQMLSKS